MTLSENISLQNYVDSANQQFSKIESRLSQIEGSFQTRMNGKTIGSLIRSMFGTIFWIATFCVFFWYIKNYVNSTLYYVCLSITLLLAVTMFIDEIISLCYYGKITSYKNSILQLKNRIHIGLSSIKSNQNIFIGARVNGWRYPLSVGTSIPEEAISAESIINGMESLKGGFIHGLKDFLYFTVVVIVTGIGSFSLFDIADDIVVSLFGGSPEQDTMIWLLFCGLLLVEIGMIILAKMWWSHTDCSVTNITLWIVPLGPILFCLLVLVISLLVMLVALLVSFVIAIAGAALAIGIACACLSGIAGG